MLGKRKLAPQSVCETIEGSLSGVILGMLICSPIAIAFFDMSLVGSILLTLGLSVIAVFGDLVKASLKRCLA